MSETTLASAVSVAASSASDCYDFRATGKFVRFRVSFDKAHSIAFYGDESAFTAATSAASLSGTSRTGLAATAGTGTSYLIDTHSWYYVGIVVTNADTGTAGTLTIAAENV